MKYKKSLIIICILLCVIGIHTKEEPIYEDREIYLDWVGYDDNGSKVYGRTYNNISILVGYATVVYFYGLRLGQC